MKCPMMKSTSIRSGEHYETVELQDCIYRDCAWFNDAVDSCSVSLIADRLDGLYLEGIEVQRKRQVED